MTTPMSGSELGSLPDALSDDPPTHLERQLLAVDLDTCVCEYCLRTQGHRVELLRALRLGHEAGRASMLAADQKRRRS